MSGELRGKIDVAAEGSWFGLVLVAMFAVGREGLETALFLWSATEAVTRSASPTWRPLGAAALGIAVAVAMGYLLYRGAISINLSRFFTWTGAFLIVVAAGVFSYGVHDLQEAAILPGLGHYLFDVSSAVPLTSWYGTLLKGIFNFSPQTSYLEAAAWLVYLVPVMTLFLRGVGRRSTPTPSSRPTPVPSASH